MATNQPRFQGRFILTVLGRAGSGKSSLIRRMVNYCLPTPVYVLDTMDEYNMGVQFDGGREMLEYVAGSRPNVTGVYVLKAKDDDDAEAFFRFTSKLTTQATIVIDEASKFCSPHYIHPELKRIISYGRHYRLHLVLSARRATELHRDVTAQSDAIVSFRQTEPRDIATLRQYYEVAGILPSLGMPDVARGQYVGEHIVMGEHIGMPFISCLEPTVRIADQRRFGKSPIAE